MQGGFHGGNFGLTPAHQEARSVNIDQLEIFQQQIGELDAKKSKLAREVSELAVKRSELLNNEKEEYAKLLSEAKESKIALDRKHAALDSLLEDAKADKSKLDEAFSQVSADTIRLEADKKAFEERIFSWESRLRDVQKTLEEKQAVINAQTEALNLDLKSFDTVKLNLRNKTQELTEREFAIVSRENQLKSFADMIEKRTSEINGKFDDFERAVAGFEDKKKSVLTKERMYETLIAGINQKQEEINREYLKSSSLKYEVENQMETLRKEEDRIREERDRLLQLRKAVEDALLKQGGK